MIFVTRRLSSFCDKVERVNPYLWGSGNFEEAPCEFEYLVLNTDCKIQCVQLPCMR